MSMKIADQDCARVLRVLADTTRLRVVELLLKHPMRVGELNDVLQMDQSLLSHHLRIMRQAGLVTSQRDGKSVRYDLASELKSYWTAEKTLDFGCCQLIFSDTN